MRRFNSRYATFFSTLTGLTVLAAASLAAPGDAHACGGCFVTGETNTVVTDHRMILSVSPAQTTLYDQIRYQGSPESFAWVLPISGEATVGLSADVVFRALDNTTQTQVFPPPLNCPPPPDCQFDARASAGGSADAAASPPGVNVIKEETVGPYQTVQLSATDPQALDAWLASNGYGVPDDVKPIIAQYVAEKFDFLAMKLVPGTSVRSMRPVRVTTRGASPVLPLRMVAAGTGPVVGITLWVIGEGRYEPQNFPSFAIKAEDLVWDWSTSSSNYRTIRASKTAASGGKAWELESSIDVNKEQIRTLVKNGAPSGRFGPRPTPPAADDEYLPIAADGGISASAEAVRDADLTTLFAGIGAAEARITRLRADLDHAALSTDLYVSAPADQSSLSPTRQVTKEANQPQCPIFQGCNSVGTAPRDEAQQNAAEQKAEADRVSASCATAPLASSAGGLGGSSSGRSLFAAAGASAFLGVVVAGLRRRRSRR